MLTPDEVQAMLGRLDQDDERAVAEPQRPLSSGFVIALTAQLVAWVAAVALEGVVGSPQLFDSACVGLIATLPVAVFVAGLVVGRWGSGIPYWLTAIAGAVAGLIGILALSFGSPSSVPDNLTFGLVAGAVLWLLFFAPGLFYARFAFRRGVVLGALIALPVAIVEIFLWLVVLTTLVGFIEVCGT